MNKISLLLILSGLLVSAGLNAHEVVKPAGNSQCHSSVRGYFFSKHHKDCPGVYASHAVKNVKPAPKKTCSCPCKDK